MITQTDLQLELRSYLMPKPSRFYFWTRQRSQVPVGGPLLLTELTGFLKKLFLNNMMIFYTLTYCFHNDFNFKCF